MSHKITGITVQELEIRVFTDAGKLTPPRLRCTTEHGPGIVVRPPLRRVVRGPAITGTGCRAMGNYLLNCEHQPLYNFLNLSGV